MRQNIDNGGIFAGLTGGGELVQQLIYLKVIGFTHLAAFVAECCQMGLASTCWAMNAKYLSSVVTQELLPHIRG